MNFNEQAQKFVTELLYKNPPFNARNWGHPWHSLCSYHGKLKPAIAYFLISEFTNKGDIVLDPFCGVGTIPFEACLQGRVGMGSDLSEMAYIVTKAKIESVDEISIKIAINQLSNYISENRSNFTGLEYKDFGFNSKLPNYFEVETYKEILAGREFYLKKGNHITAAEAMVFSAFIHVLHGNRPYALSRRSHPLTPYSPTGEFKYKCVIEKITNKVNKNCLQLGSATNYNGVTYHCDFNQLISKNISVDWIITSPPFANSIRFYMNNWMRLWLCGWEPEDFKSADERFLDKKQMNDFDIYFSFFNMCQQVLKKDGKIILHLGKTSKVDMGKELSERASKWFDIVYLSNENVCKIEKHGIKDKGSTTEHQYLFLELKKQE